MYDYHGKVIRVIDGDTLVVQVDLGFSTHVVQTIRLFGINCPEMHTLEGKKAKTFVMDWLEANSHQVCLISVKDRTDKYGRYLGGITDRNRKINLNSLLVEQGLAVQYP